MFFVKKGKYKKLKTNILSNQLKDNIVFKNKLIYKIIYFQYVTLKSI